MHPHRVVKSMLTDCNHNHTVLYIRLIWPHIDAVMRGKIISAIMIRYINNHLGFGFILSLLKLICFDLSNADVAIISRQVCKPWFSRWLSNVSCNGVVDDPVINFIIDCGFLGTPEFLVLNYRWNSLGMIKYLLTKNPDMMPAVIYELFIRRKNYVINDRGFSYIVNVQIIATMSVDAKLRLNMMIATHYHVPVLARIVAHLCECGYNANLLMDILRQVGCADGCSRSLFQYRRLCNATALFVS